MVRRNKASQDWSVHLHIASQLPESYNIGMKRILLIAVFLISVGISLALHCPDCGAKNHAKFRYCYNCGESLSDVKQWKDDSSTTKTTPTYRFSDSELEKVTRSKKKESKTPTFVFKGGNEQQDAQAALNSLGEGDPMQKLGMIRSMLQGGGAQSLMQFQNKSISQSDFSQLQSNPQVQQLMQQMKSPQFQQSLMQTLRQLQPANQGQQQQYQQQLNQIQGLFQMLNTQSGGSGIQGLESLKGLGGLRGLKSLGNQKDLQDLINF